MYGIGALEAFYSIYTSTALKMLLRLTKQKLGAPTFVPFRRV